MNIIITGASRGIGYATALELARRGQHRVLALSRNSQGLRALAEEARAGDRLRILPFDLTNPGRGDLEKLLGEWGAVDALVNNAGLLINKPFENLTDADWLASLHTNLLGPIRLIRFLLPRLKERPQAHIVNIGSMGGFQGSPKFGGLSAYSAAKASLANLTECLAEELKPYRIAVNCLALGAVDTEMLQEAFPGYQAPLSASEMATFLADFTTTGHRFFNGKILPVSVSTP